MLSLLSFSGRARRAEFCCNFILLAVANAVSHLFGPLVWGPVSLLTMIIFLALEVRRLHDLNMSGLWVLWNLMPPMPLIIICVLALTEGTSGRNRFGRDPKGNTEYLVRIG
jgi:uncharacterized membrane protein YhaH (DUF805 family)